MSFRELLKVSYIKNKVLSKVNKHKAKILWKSKSKTLNNKPFLTVKMARNYYLYSERGGQDSIAFILYDSIKNKFGLIHEGKPPMDERNGYKTKMTTAFGGSNDLVKSFKEICKIEVLEEAGYTVPISNITSIGKTLVSSQMSQICELFLVNVTGIKKTHKTENENDLVKWINSKELMKNGDWKSIYILAQSIDKKLII